MYQQNFQYTTGTSAGSMGLFTNSYAQQEDSETTELPKKHSQKINKIVEELYKATIIPRRGQHENVRVGGRKNKNEILALTLARLIKDKHLNGTKYLHEMLLAREVQMHSNNGEFVLVLRTDGRIVAMSDETEYHLEKSMRSLYTQCLNIFECLDQTDSDKLRLILNSSVDSARKEHRLICTLRLPKGKRPSRINEDVKTIIMTGHFYSCHEALSSTSNERLFIARCEALISATTNRSNSSQTKMSNNINSIIKIVLNEDMTIQTISANAQTILGYSNKDLFGNWIGRYLPTNDTARFETIRQKYFQREPEQQQLPVSVCDIFDMYTGNGDGRLTFLCQIRPIRERRKPVKFAVIAQVVDPSLRHEYAKYIRSEGEVNPKPPKAEQVNLVSSSISQTSEDAIVADSPTFANVAQLIYDGATQYDCLHHQQCSPLNGKLSNAVAPFNVHDESWNELFDTDYNEHSTTTTTTTTDFHYWPAKSIDYMFTDDNSAEELENIINIYLHGC